MKNHTVKKVIKTGCRCEKKLNILVMYLFQKKSIINFLSCMTDPLQGLSTISLHRFVKYLFKTINLVTIIINI